MGIFVTRSGQLAAPWGDKCWAGYLEEQGGQKGLCERPLCTVHAVTLSVLFTDALAWS